MGMRYHQERESNQNQSSRNKMNNFHEAENRRDLHRTPLSDHINSSGYSSLSTPTSASGPPRNASGSSSIPVPPPRSHSSALQKNDNNNKYSSFTHFGASGHHLPSYRGERALSPSNSRHPFASGEIEECDKYNPLVLHHAEIQSVPQHRELRTPLDKVHPLSRGYHDRPKDNHTHRSGAHSQEPRPHRHNLLYNQELCQMTGKLGVLTPKATSAASTTMSIALAHTTVSPSGSSSNATNASFSTGSTSSAKNSSAYKEPGAENDTQRSPNNRRMSLPVLPPTDRNSSRRMSYVATSPPKLLDTIFQRVWNPQQTSPGSQPSLMALTDDDLDTSGTSDSQLVKHPTKQDWNQGQQRQVATSSGSSSVPMRYPSVSSFTGSSSPCCSSPRGGNFLEGQQARRFNERFIHQVTFSLDESHKSGLQAILALRQLTNGLTSAKITPTPRVNGSRFSSPSIPIPRISHRYPEKSSTVMINGQPRVVNKKTIPSVVIDWSDGVRDQFDPSNMTLEEILGRCHYPSTS